MTSDKQNMRGVWKGFWLIFIPLFVIALLLVSTFYYSRTQAARHITLATETERINLQQQSITTDLDSIVSDLRFLASSRHLSGISNTSPSELHQIKSELAQEYLGFSTAKQMYDQVRYLDSTGMEIIRVNYNAGQPEIVPPEKLQNKQGRYYFDDTLALGPHEIFISPLDLNVENGSIEHPLKPMIRFGMPFFDESGVQKGIVLLNYFGSILLNRFHDQVKSSAGGNFLLNRSGYYLHCDNTELQWGFMYPGQPQAANTFSKDHPAAWAEIIMEESGQFENQEGLFTFTTENPLDIGMTSSTGNSAINGGSHSELDQAGYFWKLVSFVPAAVLYRESNSLKLILGLFLMGLTLLTIISSWKIAAARVQKRLSQEKRDLLLSELEQAHEQLKRSQSQLLQNEKMASVGQLAAGVAHEINNPMGFIAGNLRCLEKYAERFSEFINAQKTAMATGSEQDSEKLQALENKLKITYLLEDTRDLIKESLDGAERVQEIVKNLKTFSRVDQNALQMVDLHECIDSTIKTIWNELKYKTEIEKSYASLPLISCHPQQLSQVFMNLLINASHAIAEKGLLKIATSADTDFVSVAFSDNGCGISAENLPRIFEPFFTTKEIGKGTGLGLSMVFDIIKSHQGVVTVESAVGEGTTFTVKLPLQHILPSTSES